jgi:hypothetical protein
MVIAGVGRRVLAVERSIPMSGNTTHDPAELSLAALLPSDAAELLAHCTAGSTYIYGNPATFANVNPSQNQMNAGLSALSTALTTAPNGTASQKKAVKAAAKKVRNLWAQLLLYAQGVLRAVNPVDVPAMLASAMMYASKAGAHKPKAPIAARHGDTTGSVKLIALAILGALTYEWEYSLDQITWSTARSGQAHTTLAGLTAGKLYWFRVRGFLRDNTTTDPVGPISLMVI